MSDNRQESEQDLQDSLGSALETSFSIPPPPPKPAAPAAPEVKEEPAAAAPSEPIPGLAEWPETYQGYLDEWHAESAIARAKAQETHDRIEAERLAEQKAEEDKKKAAKKAAQDEEKKKKDAEKLKAELEEEEKKETEKDVRGHGKVKEAWELVGKKDDGRDYGPFAEPLDRQDALAAQAISEAQERHEVKPAAYDPTTSTDPIPPAMQDPKPVTPAPVPTESATLSRHSATSQAWEEVSRQSDSGSGEQVSAPQSSGSDDIIQIPSPEKAAEAGVPLPPTQPPSLTLSVFTNSASLSVSKIFAVIGINLVLPFINGVMLGFGEIFAREVLKVGKEVWRGERGIFGFGGRRGTGGRGTSGVGLSGGF
ncbi:hypothetical protein L202_02005 [Cryptococcus amylolentus CBS 6039]|uniref:Uncharacterized protein n=2 Tax=Cryptococcus amylolentus TaxID=104669 RepID=A0A1E3HZ17_9TREE|nr:hypothetical protein L202_02005 [Cryptococcus amylolentus CBS 6039]ODN81593.1 hypothetical protein L202_02005 [Cryptococcus amylolentus CBS 6039]ODO10184.1 hypothetical protein I350_02413 [Cryptococcus amylolentus CBS 6273]